MHAQPYSAQAPSQQPPSSHHFHVDTPLHKLKYLHPLLMNSTSPVTFSSHWFFTKHAIHTKHACICHYQNLHTSLIFFYIFLLLHVVSLSPQTSSPDDTTSRVKTTKTSYQNSSTTQPMLSAMPWASFSIHSKCSLLPCTQRTPSAATACGSRTHPSPSVRSDPPCLKHGCPGTYKLHNSSYLSPLKRERPPFHCVGLLLVSSLD